MASFKVSTIHYCRIQLEQMYSKSLRRLGQKISKASCLIISSPLSSAWNTVGLEMEKEADIHKFATILLYCLFIKL